MHSSRNLHKLNLIVGKFFVIVHHLLLLFQINYIQSNHQNFRIRWYKGKVYFFETLTTDVTILVRSLWFIVL